MRMRSAHPAGHRPAVVADLDHTLATAAVVVGAVGLVLAAFDVPLGAIALGALGMAVGLWGQMMSTTRGERFADMAGLLVSFLSLAVGFSLL
ncbi:MAG TPA: hypothetical protein VNU26_06300 [Mycobacteriales bacterium]|nr:hypothetical protein [Mycobacteriales bacterium]